MELFNPSITKNRTPTKTEIKKSKIPSMLKGSKATKSYFEKKSTLFKG